MKKVCFPKKAALIMLFMLMVGKQAYTKEIKLASWNIRNFATWNRDDDKLAVIASILQQYDLIAIQEVRHSKVIRRTTQIIREKYGKNYGYMVSPLVGNYYFKKLANNKKKIHGHYERYAFLYNRRKIRPISRSKLFHDPNRYFLRAPYFARFKSGKFDFIVVTAHNIYSATRQVKMREIYGLRMLYKFLRRYYRNERDIILTGDFNIAPQDIKAWAPIATIPYMTNMFSLPARSMISDSNLYDNIIFQSHFVREWAGRKGIYYFDHHLFANNDSIARKVCSDHRPIWCSFHTNLHDDD